MKEKNTKSLNPVWQALIDGKRRDFEKSYVGDLIEAKNFYDDYEYVGSSNIIYLNGKKRPNSIFMHLFI
jgi:hypothetical protein